MPNSHNFDDFFAEVSARTAVQQSVTQALTQEEEEELREFAIQRMANMNSSTSQEATPSEPQPQEEPVQEVPQEPECPPEEEVVEVPEYSNIREETSRFSDAEWFKKVQEQTVILAGVGGIGSNMAIILAKLNPKALYLFDSDIVESVNLAGQFYSREDIGKLKSDAIAESIIKYTNYSSVFSCPRYYTNEETIVSDVMVCGFDSMSSRRNFFNKWHDNVLSKPEEERKDCLFIDGRLTADEFQIFCMTGEDDYYIERYKNNFLFSDREAEQTRCSFKQTGYLADMIGAFMVNLLVNHCANLSNPLRSMPLPFLTSYKADVMYLNTEK